MIAVPRSRRVDSSLATVVSDEQSCHVEAEASVVVELHGDAGVPGEGEGHAKRLACGLPRSEQRPRNA